ncbi:Peptidoglycan/LPS O-acetylase OafA/YrhL, contains acyltransferase and SGNH-hydrolase domains [Mucilaginibacter pineti]|uniref:Peptidoglycan/LPS O-acetylase OafA/YrhL, contains acyltransferase and SGNH-hydrolase domains n=1 Tax=Mucilaginibacter pineti TaxID=1391627 RepID=A0A1G6W972_9SPHI|nr:acyltransferase [Mucilaginibacter pineti]SDD62359.1 Peptidoglycan/LPS O-acetylase OafA/YrhL, contains acyltransferase and SGNH-hydrolase domains [Mucilaginibacter pineti]
MITKPIFNQEGRIFGLDIIRFLAIVFVLIDHGQQLLPTYSSTSTLRNYSGVIGVELFFTLSGFLIGSILLKIVLNSSLYNKATIINFWKRRWLRTLPAYWFYFFVYTLVAFASGFVEFERSNLKTVIISFLFLQNLVGNFSAYFGVGWSLAIEEWFYFLTPLLLFICISFFKTNRRKAFIYNIILTIVFAIIIKIVVFYLIDSGWLTHLATKVKISNFQNRIYHGVRKIVLLRLDAAAYGVLFAYLYHFHKETIAKYKTVLLAVAIVFLITSLYLFKFILLENFNGYSFVLTFPLLGIAFSCLLPYFMEIKKSSFYSPVASFIQNVSIISYSIYLSHTVFLNLLIHYTVNLNIGYKIAAIAVMLALTYFASCWSYNYIERAGMKMRDNNNLSRFKNFIFNKADKKI